MKWNTNRIKRLLKIYGATQFELADFLGFSRTLISHRLNEEFNFESHTEQLSAFFKAKSDGKIKELQSLINFYEKAV